MRPHRYPAAALAALLLAPVSVAAQSAAQVACVAEAVYFEARGGGSRGRAAVAHVVLNRVEHEDFPDTPCAVVREACQFSFMCDGKPERLTEPEARAAAYRTAEAVLAGEAPDPTGGALFFHSARLAPGWFGRRDRTAEIGGQVYYR